jgi:hypothetical protein
MIGQPFIFLPVAEEFFPVILLHDTLQVFRVPVGSEIGAVHRKKILAVPDVLGVIRIEITLAERQIVDRVQQIGFTRAVVSDYAIDLPGEKKLGIRVILEIVQSELMQMH